MENKGKAENSDEDVRGSCKKNIYEGNLPSLRKVKSGYVSKKEKNSPKKVAENFFKFKQKAAPQKASPPTEEQRKKLQMLIQREKEYAAKIKLVQELKIAKNKLA